MAFSARARRARHSAAFRKAKIQARDFLADPDRLRGLVDEAISKAERYRHGPLRDIWQSLNTTFRLIRSYANGDYRVIPWESMLLLVAAVVYLLMPLDLIPDFIVGLGFLDDVALFGWVLKSVSTDLDAFTTWEAAGRPSGKKTTAADVPGAGSDG
jgi:uncharacterized membrane protein YkvA (DUF1232 family)